MNKAEKIHEAKMQLDTRKDYEPQSTNGQTTQERVNNLISRLR